MAIGERSPIAFKKLTITDVPGGAATESYAVAQQSWGKLKMVRSQLNSDGGAVAMADLYRFSEIRVREDFEPDKTMLLTYQGKDLIINSIIKDESNVPAYYTITASQNG